MKKNEQHQSLNPPIATAAPILGGCLCGTVRFSLTKLGNAVMCHCSLCRKGQGALFACNFPVACSQFEYLSGQENIRLFRSSSSKLRAFCGTCGSPLYSKKDGADTLRIRSGCLDSTADVRVVAHIFADNSPSWSPIDDGLPQHEKFEPGRKA